MSYTKERIPESLRWRIWERDNFRCCYCGARQFLSVDHIVAESRGGSLDERNLVTACMDCNRRKSSKDPMRQMEDATHRNYQLFWDEADYVEAIERLTEAAHATVNATMRPHDECQSRFGCAPEIPELIDPPSWRTPAAD